MVTRGKTELFTCAAVDGSLLIRLDMPGVTKETLSFTVEDYSLYIRGKEDRSHLTKAEMETFEPFGFGREEWEFCAKLEFLPAVWCVKEMKFLIKNGVLRVMIPTHDKVYLREMAEKVSSIYVG